MPNNAQMEARDAFEAARNRIKLIREGILDPVEGRSVGIGRGHFPSLANHTASAAAGPKLDFHIPAVRPYRLKTSAGVTSFHFAHKAVAKVTHSNAEQGVANAPGAARDHGNYIERTSAVADFETDAAPAVDQGQRVDGPDPADLCDLRKSGTEPIKRSNGPDLQPQAITGENRGLDDRAMAEDFALGSGLAGQDRYLTRSTAIAMQPEGTRALLTNIDPDDEERQKFWSLVEENERKPGPDKMSFRVSDNQAFWNSVAAQPDCPRKLKAKITGQSADSNDRFVIDDGKAMRKFLRGQPGWVELESDGSGHSPFPMAKFSDGRGGRVQYRIEGELPDDLTPAQNFALLREFCTEFENRNLPFVAVMHAPDEHNDETNWHFHIAYYDRPCRRIDQGDIAKLQHLGYQLGGVAVGDWDFAVSVVKPERSNRSQSPLRQNKVKEISRRTWPKTLRTALAKTVNHHLQLAGAERRVSPDDYETMGIAAEGQEHLGTTENAAETNGVATSAGIRNEQKQWQAMQVEAIAKGESELEQSWSRFQHAVPACPNDNKQAVVARRKVRDALETAALLRRNALLLQHEMDRAASRAAMVRKRNLKLLKAQETDPRKAQRLPAIHHLVEQATAYLSVLNEKLASERALVARWRTDARMADVQAERIEQQLKEGGEKTIVVPGMRIEHPIARDPGREPSISTPNINQLGAQMSPAPAKSDVEREIEERFEEMTKKLAEVQAPPLAPQENTRPRARPSVIPDRDFGI